MRKVMDHIAVSATQASSVTLKIPYVYQSNNLIRIFFFFFFFFFLHFNSHLQALYVWMVCLETIFKSYYMYGRFV